MVGKMMKFFGGWVVAYGGLVLLCILSFIYVGPFESGIIFDALWVLLCC